MPASGWIKNIHFSSAEFMLLHPDDCAPSKAVDGLSDRFHFERSCLFHHSRVASRIIISDVFISDIGWQVLFINSRMAHNSWLTLNALYL